MVTTRHARRKALPKGRGVLLPKAKGERRAVVGAVGDVSDNPAAAPFDLECDYAVWGRPVAAAEAGATVRPGVTGTGLRRPCGSDRHSQARVPPCAPCLPGCRQVCSAAALALHTRRRPGLRLPRHGLRHPSGAALCHGCTQARCKPQILEATTVRTLTAPGRSCQYAGPLAQRRDGQAGMPDGHQARGWQP
jgi:hypothetical protein